MPSVSFPAACFSPRSVGAVGKPAPRLPTMGRRNGYQARELGSESNESCKLLEAVRFSHHLRGTPTGRNIFRR